MGQMDEDDLIYLGGRLETISDHLEMIGMLLSAMSQGVAVSHTVPENVGIKEVQYRPWIVHWRKMKDRVLLTKDSFETKWGYEE